jgi:hypothetical protein
MLPLLMMVLSVLAQDVDPGCFNSDGKLYGTKTGLPASDIGTLRGPLFSTRAKVHQVKACGNFIALTGVQLILLKDY